MKTWRCLLAASLVFLCGCGVGLRGNFTNSDSYQYASPPESDTLISEESVKFDVPVQVNKEVRAYLVYFSKDRKEVIRRQLARSQHYLPMIKIIFQEYGLPEDLAYLAMVESGFNPKAYSPAGACGLWQFIKPTGLRYGLVIDNYVDERLDPEKSTRAAAKYLLDLYKRFGSWYLAAASYNCGEGRVQQELRKSNNQNFWDLSANKRLPNETRNYVPQMIAAIIIAKNPEKFGFNSLPAHQPLTQNDLEMAELSQSLAPESRAEAVPRSQPLAASQALAANRAENQSPAPTAGAPKSRLHAQADVDSNKKPRPQVTGAKNHQVKADAKTKKGAALYTASLLGGSGADPAKKGKATKNGRGQQLTAGPKKKTTAQMKAQAGKKPAPALLGMKPKTKNTQTNPAKKATSPSTSGKGKLAKPKSKSFLVSEAR
jgi:hypothetical protein